MTEVPHLERPFLTHSCSVSRPDSRLTGQSPLPLHDTLLLGDQGVEDQKRSRRGGSLVGGVGLADRTTKDTQTTGEEGNFEGNLERLQVQRPPVWITECVNLLREDEYPSVVYIHN